MEQGGDKTRRCLPAIFLLRKSGGMRDFPSIGKRLQFVTITMISHTMVNKPKDKNELMLMQNSSLGRIISACLQYLIVIHLSSIFY